MFAFAMLSYIQRNSIAVAAVTVMSDLHVTQWRPRLELWRAALAQLKPDMLLITGDLGHRSWRWKTSLSGDFITIAGQNSTNQP